MTDSPWINELVRRGGSTRNQPRRIARSIHNSRISRAINTQFGRTGNRNIKDIQATLASSVRHEKNSARNKLRANKAARKAETKQRAEEGERKWWNQRHRKLRGALIKLHQCQTEKNEPSACKSAVLKRLSSLMQKNNTATT